MARPEKVAVVEEIKEKLESARGVFVTEYRGLTVSQQQQLRRALRAADAEYKVMKMSLARRAATDAGLDDLLVWLEGPTAIAFTAGDPVPAAKSLKEFADEHDMLVLKGGLLAGETLEVEDVKRLASIEPREVLLAKLAGAMAGPMSKLAGLMSAILRQPASVMQQLLEKKESEPSAAPVEAQPASEEASDEDTAEEPAPQEGSSEDPPEEAVDVGEDAEEPAAEDAAEETAAEEPATEVAEADPEAVVEAVGADVDEPADSAGDEAADEDSKDSE